MANGYLLNQSDAHSQLYKVRNRLKSELVSAPRRTVFTTDGRRPKCAWCGMPVMYMAPNMHEVLITRGDMQRWNIAWELVYISYNCVLVHPGPCHEMAATKEGQLRCIESLIVAESFAQILAWLLALEALFNGKSNIVEQAIRDLNAANDNLTKLVYEGE